MHRDTTRARKGSSTGKKRLLKLSELSGKSAAGSAVTTILHPTPEPFLRQGLVQPQQAQIQLWQQYQQQLQQAQAAQAQLQTQQNLGFQ